MLTYITALNLVRLGIKHKLKFIKIPKTKKSTKLLYILLKFNVIYGWSISQNNAFVNYLVYCNSNLSNIHTFIKPRRKLNIKYKHVKIIVARHSSAQIFLSTPKGIISINEAYAKKSGGFLFFRIL